MKKINSAVLIAVLYFLMGTLWIYLTDRLVIAVSPTTAFLIALKIFKGYLYILITSLALYLLIRQANRKLRKQAEEYKILFEENPNPMWVMHWGDHFQFLAVNQAALQQFGYSREEFLRLSPLELRPPEDRQAYLQALEERLNNYTILGQWRLLKKSGEVMHAEIYLHKVAFQGSKAYLVLVLDVTGRLRVEEERKKLIEELTRQNQNLQQFAYITSHNLRAPIANIMGLVHLYAPDNKPEFNQQIIDNLGKSARNLDAVVRDLSDLLVIRTRKEEEKQLVRFESVFQLTEQSLQADLAASRGHIWAEFTAAPEVVCVRSYVQSIFYNLLSNAIKYRSPDRPLQIDVRTYPQDGFICLEVKDNGLGMDLEKNKQKLFGMYKRFHRHIPGKGLGLHLVKTQIEAVGGSIAVESQKGKGTTFKVLFPNGPEK